MAYSTQTDLVNFFPAEVLKQLSDDDDTDDIQVEKVNDAIRRADDLIDGYVRGRYTLPLATTPALIRDLSTRLAVYFMFQRSLVLTMPEPITNDYKATIKILEGIQSGKVTPFEQAAEPVFFATNKVAADKIFTSSTTPTTGQISWAGYPV